MSGRCQQANSHSISQLGLAAYRTPSGVRTLDLPLPKDSPDEQPYHLWSSTGIGQVLAAMPDLQMIEPHVELVEICNAVWTSLKVQPGSIWQALPARRVALSGIGSQAGSSRRSITCAG